MLYADQVDTDPTKVVCDQTAFWRIRDEKGGGDPDGLLAVLPWQYTVEAIVSEPGVCSTMLGY